MGHGCGVGWITCKLQPEMRLKVGLEGRTNTQLDSLLGATLQRTLYSTVDGRVLTDHSDRKRATAADVVTIGPGIDVLSNSAVNAVCGAVMATIGWWVGTW